MLHENCYVVYDEVSHEAAVIDPGFYWDEEKKQLYKFIKDNKLQVKYVLCTHLHFDHIFGTTYIEENFGVRISASLDDSPWITGFLQYVSRFGISPTDLPRPVAHPLHNGDILTLGECTLRCISTPGHSAGGMCFYIPDKDILFSGDTLFQGSIGRTDFEDGSYAQLIHSIQTQLFTLPQHTIVYPGHGDPTSIGDEMMYNPYL